MNKIKLEVNLPVYNEEKILQKSVEIVRTFLNQKMTEYDYKIVIIDNGSTDNTNQICKYLKEQYSDVDYIRINKKGRGRALRIAWLRSDADICSYMDIDLSSDINSFPALINAISKNNYDISTGSRLLKDSKIKRSLKREILSRGHMFLLKYFLGYKYSDAQCGFKAVNQKVIKNVLPHVLDQEWFFDPELLFKCQKWGYKIKDIPILWLEDTDSRVRINKMVRNNFISMVRTKLEFITDRISPEEKNL